MARDYALHHIYNVGAYHMNKVFWAINGILDNFEKFTWYQLFLLKSLTIYRSNIYSLLSKPQQTKF